MLLNYMCHYVAGLYSNHISLVAMPVAESTTKFLVDHCNGIYSFIWKYNCHYFTNVPKRMAWLVPTHNLLPTRYTLNNIPNTHASSTESNSQERASSVTSAIGGRVQWFVHAGAGRWMNGWENWNFVDPCRVHATLRLPKPPLDAPLQRRSIASLGSWFRCFVGSRDWDDWMEQGRNKVLLVLDDWCSHVIWRWRY